MPTLRLLVTAGPHVRHACPVSVPVDLPAGTNVGITDIISGRIMPGQCVSENGTTCLHWVIEYLAQNEIREYVVNPKVTWDNTLQGVTVKDTPDNRVDIAIVNRLFTAYHYSSKLARPYCYPVNDPYRSCVTRANVGEKPGETTDHEHHRSLWTSYGEVNGTNNWDELEGHGRTVHRSFDLLESGSVLGRLRAHSDWETAEGEVLLHETREFRVYDNRDDLAQIFDVILELEAANGDVHFGDTKEGGFLSVRVASTMDASGDGQIENGYGGIGEFECWGKRSCWCDYSGPVGGRCSGIAVMEHPDSFRSPTYWHVRDYGLMSTNPFGAGTFQNDSNISGAYTLPQGERLHFAYRIMAHLGDAWYANVAKAYHGYINPPKAEVID